MSELLPPRAEGEVERVEAEKVEGVEAVGVEKIKGVEAEEKVEDSEKVEESEKIEEKMAEVRERAEERLIEMAEVEEKVQKCMEMANFNREPLLTTAKRMQGITIMSTGKSSQRKAWWSAGATVGKKAAEGPA